MRPTGDATLTSTELAHHLLSALPAGDVTRAITSAREASRAAARIGAHSDACALLRHAFEALRLRPEIEPQTACELLYDLARFERANGEPTSSSHLDQAVALARRHGFTDILVSASQLVSGPPGTVSSENANDVLEAAPQSLPRSEHAQRAMLLAHMSWTPPNSWKQQRVNQLLEEAIPSPRPPAMQPSVLCCAHNCTTPPAPATTNARWPSPIKWSAWKARPANARARARRSTRSSRACWCSCSAEI